MAFKVWRVTGNASWDGKSWTELNFLVQETHFINSSLKHYSFRLLWAFQLKDNSTTRKTGVYCLKTPKTNEFGDVLHGLYKVGGVQKYLTLTESLGPNSLGARLTGDLDKLLFFLSK